jgi:hypothetical protein
MRKYFFGALALAAITTAATALPALSTDSGTVAVSITAQAPPAPCLTLSPSALDFGVLPFAAPGGPDIFDRRSMSLTNCGTAGENVLASTTNASGPSGSWTPTSVSANNPCPTTNVFALLWTISAPGFRNLLLTGTPRMALDTQGQPWVFPAGSATSGGELLLGMPCQGSNGAGDTKTLTATFTAVVA